MREGYGEFYWKNGNTYKGEWKENMIEGKGDFIYRSRKGESRYRGVFIANK